MRLRCDGPAQSRWCGPDQGARPGLPQTPSGRALHPVIVAASTGNIAGTGQAALDRRDRVIKVAPRRHLTADGNPQFRSRTSIRSLHPVGDPVSGGGARVGARTPDCRPCCRSSRRRGRRGCGPTSTPTRCRLRGGGDLSLTPSWYSSNTTTPLTNRWSRVDGLTSYLVSQLDAGFFGVRPRRVEHGHAVHLAQRATVG